MLFFKKTKEFTNDKVAIFFLSKNKLYKIKALDLHHTLFSTFIYHTKLLKEKV